MVSQEERKKRGIEAKRIVAVEPAGYSVPLAAALREGALVEAREHPQQMGPVGQVLPCPSPGKHHVPRLAGLSPLAEHVSPPARPGAAPRPGQKRLHHSPGKEPG